MTLEEEIKRLGLLDNGSESLASMLDDMGKNLPQSVCRMCSSEKRDGYYFDPEWMLWFEGDALFRERVKALYKSVPPTPK